ncbi:hypothetical protein [Achromobacter sp. DH1f]|uniref:hypothetical protein n=1 Tax=Achromobacter sp. DH1f TaxID=1397275 RepID=UPI00046A02F5|nr:hypothetical protein [Achromobacter sp. DH1f]
MEFSVTKCPHCGGVSGVLTTVRFKAIRLNGWNGQDQDTENFEVQSETDPRCIDCSKPVRAYVVRAFQQSGQSAGR